MLNQFNVYPTATRTVGLENGWIDKFYSFIVLYFIKFICLFVFAGRDTFKDVNSIKV